MIREAEPKDIPYLYRMAQRFFEYAQFEKKGIELEASTFKLLAYNLIESESGIVLVATDGNPVGSVGGMIHPGPFNLNDRTLTELWWWVNPESRGIGKKLLDAFLKKGSEKADRCIMVTLDSKNEGRLKEFYENEGFAYLESHYIKEL